jgi:hypothetical protein
MATFWVSPPEIRKIFNDNGYFERVKSGAWTKEVVESETVRLPDHPAGTKSQIVHYRDELDRVVAIVHQYLKPNGKIGGKGKPDPKWLEYDGDMYHAL